MTSVEATPTIRNGINVDVMYGTLDAIKANPTLGKFQFRARNRWVGGTHNQSSIDAMYGASQELERTKTFTVDAGEPAILLGNDEGPNPAEYLLHALAACMTITLVNVASARGVKLNSVESWLEGDADVQGALGLNKDVRNGFQNVTLKFKVDADAPQEKIDELVARAQARSFVFDSLTRGVPVSIQSVH
jgi:uncharacterized OsmC-like protein